MKTGKAPGGLIFIQNFSNSHIESQTYCELFYHVQLDALVRKQGERKRHWKQAI